MTRFSLILVALFAASPSLRAQEAVNPPPAPPPPPATAAPPVFLAEAQPGPWSVQLILGLPTGIRVQREIDGTDGRWIGEGFVGLEGILPMFGGGARRRLSGWGGDCDALELNFGAGAYLLLNPYSLSGNSFLAGGSSSALAVLGDVELVWRHAFSGAASEFGLRLGAGPAFGRGWGVVPIAGIFFGLRF